MLQSASTSRNRMGPWTGAAMLCTLAGNAFAEPPPFLPPSLQEIVEKARAEKPDVSDRDLGDVRAVAAGDMTLGDVIKQLGHDDFETRERATATLASVAFWDEDLLARAHELPDICAETRERILGAMFQRFQNSPRPAIGIQMDPQNNEFGIKILSVQQQFPSSRTLRADDVILKMGETDFRPDPRNTYQLQVATASFDPGDLVDMLILRDNREIPIRAELGQYEDLQGQASPRTDSMLQQAFELRLHRLGLSRPGSGAIAAPVSRFDWERANRPMRVNDRGGMVSGGEASPVPGRPSGGIAIADSRVLRVERGRNEFKQPERMDDPGQIAANREGLQTIVRDINSVQRQLNDPRTSEQDRAALRLRLIELTKHRDELLDR